MFNKTFLSQIIDKYVDDNGQKKRTTTTINEISRGALEKRQQQ